eukprot:759397-Pyramimonas_sp.AAC.1
MEGTAAVDTFYDTGPMYFGAQPHISSHPDHLRGPCEAVQATQTRVCRRRAMRDLQRTPSPHFRDHCPMLWKLRCRLQTAPPPETNKARWDRDLLRKALKIRRALEFAA